LHRGKLPAIREGTGQAQLRSKAMGIFTTSLLWQAMAASETSVLLTNLQEGSATLTWDSTANPTLEVGEEGLLSFGNPPGDPLRVTVIGFTENGEPLLETDLVQSYVMTEDTAYASFTALTITDLGSVCFVAGTRIATPAGEVPVEALRPGDLVLTADGRAVPVRFLGRQTVDARFGPPWRARPVRIAAGALAEGVPARDLMVSPTHALLIDGVLVMAAALVNGTTIQTIAPPAERFAWFSIETATHEAILAEGCPAETFMDHVPRRAWDNHAEYLALHGAEATIAESPLPHAKSRRQVPRAILSRIAARAAAAGIADAA
jgi:hypothetical protein